MKEDQKIVIYQTEDGQTQIDVRLENETVWLTQAQMAELFEKDRTVVGRHISNVFKEGELVREEVSAKIAHTTRHGAIKVNYRRKRPLFIILTLLFPLVIAFIANVVQLSVYGRDKSLKIISLGVMLSISVYIVSRLVNCVS